MLLNLRKVAVAMDSSSWFKIQNEALSAFGSLAYSAPIVPISEEASSFSTLSIWFYIVFFCFIIGLGKFAQHIHNFFQFKLSNFSKVASVLFSVFLVYSSFVVMLLWSVPFSEVADKVREGTFGDSFGTLNALFSGLAFSGVLLTMLFQRKDLSETRLQIANQQIESQFYSMLEQQQEVVRNFDLQEGKGKSVISKGRDCFKIWVAGISHYYYKPPAVDKNSKVVAPQYPVELPHDQKLIFAYDQLMRVHKADLGLYFRSLYSVFRFIDNCNHDERGQFGLVARSLLSDNELVLLFYNCMSLRGEKFKKYVYRYALFDNLEVSMLVRPEDIKSFSYQAYGSNRFILESLDDVPTRKG